MITLGVAIAVPEPYAERLRLVRESIGDPEARTITPHVTLVAPVSVDPSVMPVVEQHLADAVSGIDAFRMHLHGTGTFRPVTRVVFVAISEGISSCEILEDRVRSGPLALERTFPFHPHVTVALDLPDERLDEAFDVLGDFDAVFVVDHIALFELKDDGWEVRRTFKLG